MQRQIDRATDVLSFPMADYETPGDFSHLVDKVFEQAEEYGHSLLREYAFLIAHSMLHLFGYDHMEEVERKEMEMHQKKIMELVNITR